MRPLFILCIMLLIVPALGPAAAQNEGSACPGIVTQALESLGTLCESAARNQACYGHFTLEALLRPGFSGADFDTPGDILDLAGIQLLRTGPLDENSGTWGLALLLLQASLPDTLPGQNVTVLLFGQASIEAGEAPQEGPPLQAFYLQTGIGQAACTEAPDGVLIQTPQGVGRLQFTINEVLIDLGSTVYLQSAAGDALYVYVLEGEAAVTAFGLTIAAPAGVVIRIPLDDELRASGPPQPPWPYDPAALQSVPAGHLQYDIVIADLQPQPFPACTGSSTTATTVYSGPGSEYEPLGELMPDTTRGVRGQALDSTGARWYLVDPPEAGSHWLLAAHVVLQGDCGNLPSADPPPEGYTPIEDEATRIDPWWHNGQCSTLSGRTRVYFGTGSGGWENQAEAVGNAGSVTTTVVIDGRPGPTYIPQGAEGPLPVGHPGHPWQYIWITEAITLTPGPHELFFTRSERGWTASISCTYEAGD